MMQQVISPDYMRTRSKLRKSQRGMAFALTMLILFTVLVIALIGSIPQLSSGTSNSANGLLNFNQNAIQQTTGSLNHTVAFDDAESGIEYTLEWLHNQSPSPQNNASFAPALWNGTTSGNRTVVPVSETVNGSTVSYGSFSVRIYPWTQNTSATQCKYLIESEGTYNGVTDIVTAFVQQASLSKYAYFTDMDDPAGYWVVGMNSFDGPMHSNNSNGDPTNFLWFSADNTNPIFDYAGVDAYTTSASTIGWNKNTIGTVSAPTTSADWSAIAVGGQSTVRTGANRIPLPTSSNQQLISALGGATAPSGSTPSVVIPTTSGSTSGGIYIHGAAQQVTFSASGPNAVIQNIQITQVDSSTVPATTINTFVTIDPTQNQTSTFTVSKQGSTTTTSPTTTVTGTTNGTVYDDSSIGHQETPGDPNYDSYSDSVSAYNAGDLFHGQDKSGGVSGVLADNYYNSSGVLMHTNGITVATASNSNMNIDGSITTNTQRAAGTSGGYATEGSDTNYLKKAGTLGLISDSVEVVDKTVGGTSLNNVVVDGSVLAYDTFDACNTFGRPKGTFQVMGGYIAQTAGFFGVIDNNGNLFSGMAESYYYDARLASNPPPYFPTTLTSYDVISWQRVTSTIE
jgi:hypothetical protein